MLDLKRMAKDLAEQDNRGTSCPVWLVYSSDSMKNMVAVCLTQRAADRFMASQKHNYPKAFVFVESEWRNTQWQDVREFLMKGGELMDVCADLERLAEADVVIDAVADIAKRLRTILGDPRDESEA